MGSSSNFENDILQEIPNSDLPSLMEILSRSKEWAPYILNFLSNVMKWKKDSEFCNFFVVLSPIYTSKEDLCWKYDGSIVILIKPVSGNMLIFSNNDYSEQLYKGLIETKRIDWSQRVRFYCTHDKHMLIVNRVLEFKKITSAKRNPNFSLLLDIDCARNIEIIYPSDVDVRNLEPKHAKIIDTVYPHKFPGSDKYIEMIIRMNGGIGIFLKDSDCLVSWVLWDIMNHLGLLQTLDEYKGKGYGKLVTQVLCRKLAEAGYSPFATVLVNNKASLNLFDKLGFKNIGRDWYVVKN